MFADLMPVYALVYPFLLVLFRLLGVMAFLPLFSNSAIPGNVKVLLSLAIAFCVWNAVPGVRALGGVGMHAPETLPGLVFVVAGEMSVGLVMGLILAAMFAGLQLGAQLVSQQMGLSIATLYDPSFEDQSTVIEQIAFWIAMVTFLSLGGHRQVLNAVVYSFQTVPVGSGGLSADVMMRTGLGALDASFHAATRVAMPGLVAFFVATITGGLMSRSMPQLNFMSVGIGLNLLVGLTMVMLGLAGWAVVSEETVREAIGTMERVVGG